jgi:serine/threonine-protein kinase HipA
MKELNVFYEDQLVGILTRNDDLVYGFSYTKTWQHHPKSFPLSLAMPLTQESFGNRITLSFFENLLPEGDVKESLERAHGITGVFNFLENYGKDCAGAIVVTDQKDYVSSIDSAKTTPIDMKKVYSAIDEKSSVADVIADMNPGYLSLAGAQDKFPAIYKEGSFLIPTQGAPTTHIVKAPIQHAGIIESVFNEYYCMELARDIGFNIPKCFIAEGRHPLFVIERYDRYCDATGNIHRIHQQDFCQAQGKTSEFKYEDKGGPTLKENYLLITNNVQPANRLLSIQNYFEWISFNLLIGNHDSHAKNISFLLQNNKNELAPFYDLICTSIYPKLKRQFSFKIGDRDDFTQIGGSQIKWLENDLGLKEGTFRKHLKKIHDKVLESKDSVAERIGQTFPKANIPLRISSLITDRSKSLKLQGAL